MVQLSLLRRLPLASSHLIHHRLANQLAPNLHNVLLIGLYRSSGGVTTNMTLNPGTLDGSSDKPLPLQYVVVFDAGSTGTRVHVYQFEVQSSGPPKLVTDHFKQNQGPGLSGFGSDVDQAVDSVRPLLEYARNTVPQHLQPSTPVELRATAGLRQMEPKEAAQQILTAVGDLLAESGMQVADDAVSIMEGGDEGKYYWVTVNYLLGRLGQVPAHTSGIVDLGGGSVQQAYATTVATPAGDVPAEYILPVQALGKEYNVYVHSYPYGLMKARITILQTPGSQACMASDASGVHKYGGEQAALNGTPEGARYNDCRTTVVTAMAKDQECGMPKVEALGLVKRLAQYNLPRVSHESSVANLLMARSAKVDCARYHPKRLVQWLVAPANTTVKQGGNVASVRGSQDQCSFAGAWGGPPANRGKGDVYVGSFFWDRAIATGLVEGQPGDTPATTPKKFAAKADEICQISVKELPNQLPGLGDMKQEDLSCLCLDMVYAATVLTEGMGMKEDQEFKLIKKVPYNGEAIEAAWTLGLAIESLSKVSSA